MTDKEDLPVGDPNDEDGHRMYLRAFLAGHDADEIPEFSRLGWVSVRRAIEGLLAQYTDVAQKTSDARMKERRALREAMEYLLELNAGRDVMRLALKSLEYFRDYGYDREDCEKSIEKLKEQLKVK